MTPLPLNLCVFDTAKQHFDRFTIYQRAINSLAAQIPLGLFANRYVHIKVDPARAGEKTRCADEMGPFYKVHGFEVHVTEGSFKHFAPSHQAGYCRDMIAMYNHVVDQRIPYTWHLESDWQFATHGDELVDLLSLGLRYLDHSPHCIQLRIPRFLNEMYRLSKVREKHGLDVDVAPESRAEWSSFARSNDLSLNPSLFRTRDLYAATRILDINFTQFGFHAEMGFTNCLKWLSPDKLCYALYDQTRFNCLHVGTREGEEDVVPATWVS